MERFVIIGGGIAGTTAAESIRKQQPGAEITLIDAEGHPLYSRVLLRNVVKGQIDRERVFMKKLDWYAENNIEWLNNTRITKIDTKNAFVETSHGRELPYDKLLIASGGDVRLIPEDKRGVSYFRTLDDTDHLMNLLKHVKTLPQERQHGVTLGGSFIALDYINIFQHFHIPQTVVMRSDQFWSKVISKESSDVLVHHCQNSGVTFKFRQSTPELLGDTELMGIRLEDGEEISAQILGVGIGIQPDFVLFKDAGIECDRGILSNECLETNVQNVYTAGDVAQFNDVIAGRQVLVGNWLNAITHGRMVAKTMMGERSKVELVTSYATELLGKEIVFAGDVDRAAADEVRQIRIDDENAIEVFDRGAQTVGAVLIGDVSERQKITDAIKKKERYA